MVKGMAMKQLPGYADLTKRLRFSPEQGRIWRDSERCVLLSQSALTTLRSQLVAQLGLARARRLFWDMGFAEGRGARSRRRNCAPIAGFSKPLRLAPKPMR